MEFSSREACEISHRLHQFNYECCVGEFRGDKRMYKRGRDLRSGGCLKEMMSELKPKR